MKAKRLSWTNPYFGVRHSSGGDAEGAFATVTSYVSHSELLIIGTVGDRPYQTISGPESFFGHDHAGKAMLRAEQLLCLGK